MFEYFNKKMFYARRKNFVLPPRYEKSYQVVDRRAELDRLRAIPNNKSAIDLRSQSIINEIANKERAATAPAVLQNVRSLIESQKRKQEAYLNRVPMCPLNQLRDLRDHISNLDPNKFKELIANHYYDPVVMKEAICTTNSLFYLLPNEPGNYEINDRVREWITRLKQIGSPSVEGYALSSGLTNNLVSANDLFVVKAPRDPLFDNLLHELFVAFQLNELRQYNPNFAITYGGFKGTPPVIDSNKQVVSWNLKSTSPVNYILYENIQPAVPFGKYVENTPFEEILDKYLQVLYALLLANNLLDYTHYDLHAENVLIRDIPNNEMSVANGVNGMNGLNDKVAIPYLTERDEIEYVMTDKIATIIDYGFNHVKVDGVNYGIYDRGPYGVNADRSFPIHDAYKLMMWLAFRMKSALNMDYRRFESLFRFFNKTDNFDNALDTQIRYVYSLPYNNQTASIKLTDFLTYIRQTIPEASSIVVQEKPNKRILGCNGTDVCTTKEHVVETLELNQPITVSSVLQFYDVVSRLNAENRLDAITDISTRFDFNQALQQAFVKFDQINARIANLRKNLFGLNIETLRVFTLLNNKEVYQKHQQYVMSVLEIWDLIHTLIVLIDAIRYVYDWGLHFGKLTQQDYNEFEGKVDIQISPAVEEINLLINQYLRIYDHLMNLYRQNPRTIDIAVKQGNPIAKWYWVTYPSYTQIIMNS